MNDMTTIQDMSEVRELAYELIDADPNMLCYLHQMVIDNMSESAYAILNEYRNMLCSLWRVSPTVAELVEQEQIDHDWDGDDLPF